MSDLHDAVDRLARSSNRSELIAHHTAATRAVKASRRAGRQRFGALAECFAEAMRIWDGQQAEGVPFAERARGLAQTLKAAWPNGRDEPWKFKCATCEDRGLEMLSCPGDATCGRPRKHLPHDFGKPCWCQAGNRFKEKPKQADDDFKAAGRAAGPQQVGRW